MKQKIQNMLLNLLSRFEWAQPHRRLYRLEVAAEERELLQIKDFLNRICDAAKCTPREAANIKLAVDEACTNIIRHAYKDVKDGKILMEAGIGPRDIQIKIIDTGKSFDFIKVKDPDLNKYVDIGKKGGLGIWLIKKVMSRVTYRTREGRNILTMTRILSEAPPMNLGIGRKSLPVSAKFTAGSVLLTVIIIVSAYFILSHRHKSLLFSQQREKVQGILRAVASEAGEAVIKKKDLDLTKLIQEVVSGDKTKVLDYAFVVGQDDKFLAHSDLDQLFKGFKRAKGQLPLTEPGVRTLNFGDVTDYGIAIYNRGRLVGEVHAGLSTRAVEQLIRVQANSLRLFALLALVLSVVFIYLLSQIITRPIQKIFEGVQALSAGNMDAKIQLDTQDEFGQLANIFNEMTGKIQESQKGMMEHERLQKEMQVAQEIQHTLLPSEFPQIEGYEIGAVYRAAKEVGGDYYDFFWVDPTTMGIVVADVSGKGVPGSLVMTMIRTAMRLEARGNKSASDVLGRVNSHVTADMKRGMFVTMFYVVLDSRNRVINFASAGHNPMILFRAKSKDVYFLKPKGFPLGISLPDEAMFQKSLALQKVSLEKDDMLVIYTDGITEAMNPAKEQFGENRFIDAIKKNSHLTPAEFVEELNRLLAEFTRGAEQNDDITLVAIKEKMKAENVLFKFRKKLMDSVEKKGLSVAEACRQLNVSTGVYYRYKKMVDAGGQQALKSVKRKTSAAMSELTNDQKKAVLAAIREHPDYGPSRIAEVLRKLPENPIKLDEKYIYAYLKRKGLNTAKGRQGFASSTIDTI